MFDITLVEKLLIDRKIRAKELLSYIGRNYNGSLRFALKGDPKSSIVEKIADFFNLPMDYFFNREISPTVNNGVISSGSKNHLNNINIGCDNEYLKRIVDEKEKLIEEKNRTIKLLEEMLELVRNNSEKSEL